MDASSYVVVALPSERDPVNKYSSEKKPHLTLLYLDGSTFDDAQFELVSQQVQFASTLLSPFMMHVKDRGTLGDKNADVLFFEKTWSANIARFRDNLLRNDLIMASYLAADQFPQWSPHLTMGYPETPSPKDNREDPGFWYVNFDRIALWTGESEGPEFKLEHPDYDNLEVAMSQIARGRSAVEDVLGHSSSDFDLEDEYGGLLDLLSSYVSEVNGTTDEVKHFGVKGMHWGVRKAEVKTPREPLKSLGPDSVSRKTASGETITLKKLQPTKIHNLIGRMSKKYAEEYTKSASLDILDGSGKKVGDALVEKKNNDELYLNWLGINKSARGKGYATAVMKAGRDFGKQQGFKRMTLEVPGNSPDARHIYEKLGFKVTKEAEASDDVWGGLTEMAYEFDAAHSSLVHYGVKGMKWGQRKADSGSASSEDARIFEKDSKRIQTHGTRSLSNKELQSVLNRMNMENQYHNLSANNRDLLDAGHQQVTKILKIGKTVEEARKFLNTPTGKAIKNGLFGAATVGAAYATGGASSAAAAGAQVAVRRASNHFTNTGN